METNKGFMIHIVCYDKFEKSSLTNQPITDGFNTHKDMKTAKTVGAKDYPSIEAFLRANRHLRRSRVLTSDKLKDTINGRNCIVVMSKTRGTSGIVRKVFHRNWKKVSVKVTSESTSRKATLKISAWIPAWREHIGGLVFPHYRVDLN